MYGRCILWYRANPVRLSLVRHFQRKGQKQNSCARRISTPAVSPFFLRSGGYCFPHTNKVRNGEKSVVKKHMGYGGEDAFFTDGKTFLGVADGVHEWRTKGVNAGLFSRALVKSGYKFCIENARPAEKTDSALPDNGPYITSCEVFQAAEAAVKKQKLQGSSTLCVFGILPYEGLEQYLSQNGSAKLRSMNEPNTIRMWAGQPEVEVSDVSSLFATDSMVGHCVNLGDSGVFVFRPSTKEVLFRSAHQEHRFGCPFQISHENSTDTFSEAQSYYIGGLQKGDMAIAGSDGLFDNVRLETLMDISVEQMKKKSSPQQIAMALVKEAFENSINKKIDTPYSLSATEEFSLIFRGGKKDDIVVVVAQLDE